VGPSLIKGVERRRTHEGVSPDKGLEETIFGGGKKGIKPGPFKNMVEKIQKVNEGKKGELGARKE